MAMAAENAFDIVSKVDLQEVSNAIQQALKEIHQRFDLKDSHSEITIEGKEALSWPRRMILSSRRSMTSCRRSWSSAGFR